MLPVVRRIRRLLDRYRVDRGLPPQVVELIEETLRCRRDHVIDRHVAERRAVIGEGPGPTGRLGRRRLRTAGALDRSLSDLALDVASTVSAVFEAADLDHYVTDRRRDQVVIGMSIHDRARALRILARADLGPGWFVRRTDRGRSIVVPLCDADRRQTRRSPAIEVFRSMQIGDRATGPDSGAALRFYELGASGELELVGVRGHERFDARSERTAETLDGHVYPGRSAFPVQRNLERLDVPVDVVYTWVDGDDVSWRDAFLRTASNEGRSPSEEALDPARFRSRDELRYSLRSLWMYGGWVRRIFLVTAGQRPAWLREDAAITLIDHQTILPSDALPTFNSHAIEASLHRIPDLAEHFVYFNDDMFLGRPTRPELFFTSNGLARVFQGGARVAGFEDDRTLAFDSAARRGREILERRFGRSVAHKPFHSPYPLRRSTLETMEEELADEFDRTRRSRFRSPSDVSVAASLGQHYGLAIGSGVLGEIATEYVHVESDRLNWHLDRIRLAGRFDTFCVNETKDRSINEQRERRLADFFDDAFPVAAPWEA